MSKTRYMMISYHDGEKVRSMIEGIRLATEVLHRTHCAADSIGSRPRLYHPDGWYYFIDEFGRLRTSDRYWNTECTELTGMSAPSESA